MEFEINSLHAATIHVVSSESMRIISSTTRIGSFNFHIIMSKFPKSINLKAVKNAKIVTVMDAM
jgi:hypothetical protein